MLNNKVHLLHRATIPIQGEMAVFYNAQKQTQRVKQNGETEETVPNEETR